MPSLSQLKQKWFIPMDGSNICGVPCRRHTDIDGIDALSVSTDGNSVTPLIDGMTYMRQWRDQINALKTRIDPTLFHAGWKLNQVRPGGNNEGGPTSLDILQDANNHGVKVHVLLCANVATYFTDNCLTQGGLELLGIAGARLDNRYPRSGSNHSKFSVFLSQDSRYAQLGSIDISDRRWDTQLHSMDYELMRARPDPLSSTRSAASG